jgi:plasmid stabilization system protein ParE
MALKLVWTKSVKNGYARIVEYLEKEFTDREVRNFVRETNHFFDLLKENPYLLEPTQNKRNMFRGPINRLTFLVYSYKPHKKEIVLIHIRGTRRKPL